MDQPSWDFFIQFSSQSITKNIKFFQIQAYSFQILCFLEILLSNEYVRSAVAQASSRHCFSTLICSSLSHLNVSLNFRMVLILYSDTFHLMAGFYYNTKGKMRNKKKFFAFVSFTFCIVSELYQLLRTITFSLSLLNLDAKCHWLN